MTKVFNLLIVATCLLGIQSIHATFVAVSKSDGLVEVWNIDNLQLNFTIKAHSEKITAMQLIDGGRVLATASEDRTIRTWDLITGERICNFDHDKTDPNGLIELRSGYLGSTRANGKKLRLWDTKNCSQIKPGFELGDEVDKNSWLTPINDHLFAVGFEKKVKVYDLEKGGKEVASLKAGDDLTDVVVSSKFLYTANEEGKVRVWDVNNNFKRVDEFKADVQKKIDLRLSAVGDSRLVTWNRKLLCVWNEKRDLEGCVGSEQKFQSAQVLHGYKYAGAHQPDGTVYLLTSNADSVSIWNLNERKVLVEVNLPSGSSIVSFIQLDTSVLFPEASTTQAQEETTPVQEETTPAQEETTPVQEETTPVQEETTPAQEETTPAQEETTPAQEETTPAQEETTPAQEETTPVQEETTPAQEETTPAQEETTPAQEETTPAQEETTPVQEETTPAQEETTPAQEETTPVQEETTPVQEETTPAQEETTPAQEETTPVQEETTPAQEETTPVQEETTPEETTPVQEETTPVQEEETATEVAQKENFGKLHKLLMQFKKRSLYDF